MASSRLRTENKQTIHVVKQAENSRVKRKFVISTPTTGFIRYEWAIARFGQIIPMNWETKGFDVNYHVLGYGIDDAYNLITKQILEWQAEWLLIIEDDVIVPNDLIIKVRDYMEDGSIPIVSGVYYVKANPTKPMIFRGRGTGSYLNWKPGDKVWCDGLPMGCLLIHTSILKYMWERSEIYKAHDGSELNRLFHSPQQVVFDPATGYFGTNQGTQDLAFFDRMLDEKVLKNTGWSKIARKKYPLLCDTSIFCKHICRNTGVQYP